MPSKTVPTPQIQPGFLGNLRFDALAGFLVFLIALPLCLAISRASGFPPIAGIWTAVIGGVICSLISNSQLTIKGPAAGLIVIVYEAVVSLGHEFGAGLGPTEQALLGYKLALGIGVTAGVLQILMGLARAGSLVDFFPLTPVHGMLASIGIIIIAKQSYEVLGASATAGAGPLSLLYQLPSAIRQLNPEIAIIGLVSLAILFALPFAGLRIPALRKVPAQLVVLLVAMGLGLYFDLEHRHTYLFPQSFFHPEQTAAYEVGPRFLVEMPNVLKNPSSAFAFPDFRGLATVTGLKFLLLFTLIGSLESLLSAKAIDLIDPWRRKTNFDRDMLAVGFANTLASAVGGLPMISEIVRSKANIDNGARTRASNFFHGLFLLAFVLLFPNLIHRIPLAALGAMLVYTGFRLANPREFVSTYRIGSEQLVVFLGTIVATLATDLLIGIAVGIGIKLAFHLWNGAPLSGIFKSDIEIAYDDDEMPVLNVRRAAVFSNWLGLKRAIVKTAADHDMITLDMSNTRLVDHSVMEKLHELQHEFETQDKRLVIVGLDNHQPLSSHPQAARKFRPNDQVIEV
jgi:MFS superfamily sulfate permease-like transporter